MKKILFLGLLWLFQNVSATTENAFLYQVPLTQANNSLQKVALPLSVLSQLKRTDYADIAVFNQQHQRLDSAVDIKESVIEKQQKQEQDLTFYILNQNKQGGDSSETQTEFWQAQKKQSETRKIKRTFYQDERLQYIIALPQKKYYLQQIKLKWQSFHQNKLIPLKIESSDDLTSWHPVKYRVVMAELRLDQQRVLRNTIDLPYLNARYLRISEIETRGLFKLTTVKGYYSYTQQQTKPKQWRTVKTTLESKNNALLLDTGGIIPFSEIRFQMPQQNIYYQGRIYSRENPEQPWIYQKEIQQYHLQIDNEWITSSALTVPSTHHRYWKIELNQPQPITNEQIPIIKIAEKTVYLYFLAQGEKPYLLTFGKGNIRQKPLSPIFQMLFNQKNRPKADSIFLQGSITTLTQPQTIPPKKLPWKTILLWIILCLGTLLMANMAWKLYREMR